MNQKGFAPIVILLIVVGIIAIGGILYYSLRESYRVNQQPFASTSTSETNITTTTVSSTSPNIVVSETTTTSSPTSSKVGAYIKLRVNLPNGAILTDSSGRQTGRDIVTGIIYEDIPGVSYSETSSYATILYSDPPAGSYTLSITGTASSSDEELLALITENQSQTPSDEYFSGPIDDGQVATYSLHYDPNIAANNSLQRTSLSAPTPSMASSTIATSSSLVNFTSTLELASSTIIQNNSSTENNE